MSFSAQQKFHGSVTLIHLAVFLIIFIFVYLRNPNYNLVVVALMTIFTLIIIILAHKLWHDRNTIEKDLINDNYILPPADNKADAPYVQKKYPKSQELELKSYEYNENYDNEDTSYSIPSVGGVKTDKMNYAPLE